MKAKFKNCRTIYEQPLQTKYLELNPEIAFFYSCIICSVYRLINKQEKKNFSIICKDSEKLLSFIIFKESLNKHFHK